MKLIPWDYAARNLGRNRLRLALSLGGCALVSLLVLAAAAFVRGMEKSLSVSGGERNVLLIGVGSEESLERSEIVNGVASVVEAEVPGIKTALGVPYVSPEVQMAALVKLEKDSHTPMLALFRGVTPAAYLVHPQIRIVDGRAPAAGELLVGRMAAARMGVSAARLAVGNTVWLEGREWSVSGHFEAPHTVMEAELWCPLKDLQIAARRDNVSTVALTLDTATFEQIDKFCKRRLDLELTALAENDYYAQLAEFYRPVKFIVWTTALLIALGGLLGGISTMYAAFAARSRELGMLQCLGYGRLALLVSMTQEALLVAMGGALLAAGAGMLLLDGLAVRVTMGAFGLSVDAAALLAALGGALVLGLCGALPPAFATLRTPIAEALKK